MPAPRMWPTKLETETGRNRDKEMINGPGKDRKKGKNRGDLRYRYSRNRNRSKDELGKFDLLWEIVKRFQNNVPCMSHIVIRRLHERAFQRARHISL